MSECCAFVIFIIENIDPTEFKVDKKIFLKLKFKINVDVQIYVHVHVYYISNKLLTVNYFKLVCVCVFILTYM